MTFRFDESTPLSGTFTRIHFIIDETDGIRRCSSELEEQSSQLFHVGREFHSLFKLQDALMAYGRGWTQIIRVGMSFRCWR
jgi:hypothetical protein